MKILFGEMSDLLLKSSCVSAQKIQNAGYKFLFPDLKTALSDLLQ
jgi:NAD dependent epimerase/dehydratase family enzyme